MKYSAVRAAANDRRIRQAGGTVREERVFKLGLYVTFRDPSNSCPRDRIVARRRNGDGALHPLQFLRPMGGSQIGQQTALVDNFKSKSAGRALSQLIVVAIRLGHAGGRDNGDTVVMHSGGG
jgi:hypothetical protein